MRLREVKSSFLAILLFLLGGCFEDPTATAYENLVSIPENAQRCSQFSALPDADRVSLYMHGATKVRPREFILADCFSEVDVGLWRELLTSLGQAKNARDVFALILVMHGIVDSQIVYPVDGAFRAVDHCGQDIPCLKLARDIDKKLDAQREKE